VRFCEGQCLRPRSADNTTLIREACANTDQEVLHSVLQEVEFRFDVARAIRGAHIELY
jgi:hypothetical protein